MRVFRALRLSVISCCSIVIKKRSVHMRQNQCVHSAARLKGSITPDEPLSRSSCLNISQIISVDLEERMSAIHCSRFAQDKLDKRNACLVAIHDKCWTKSRSTLSHTAAKIGHQTRRRKEERMRTSEVLARLSRQIVKVQQRIVDGEQVESSFDTIRTPSHVRTT